MVPRYTRPVMAAIWSPENRYRIWFEIEALAETWLATISRKQNQYGAIRDNHKTKYNAKTSLTCRSSK